MLTKMRLENFKSWRELDLDLSNITILFGTNSSGKSSVLQSLLLLKQTAMGFDKTISLDLGGSEQDFFDFGSYRDLVCGHKENNRIGIRLTWSSQEDEITYDANWRQLPDRIIVENLRYRLVDMYEMELFLNLKWKEANRYEFETPPGVSLLLFPPIREPENDNNFILQLRSCYLVERIPFSRYEGMTTDDGANLVDDKGEPAYHEIFFDSGLFNYQFESLMETLNYLGPLRSYPKRYYSWRGTAPREIGPSGDNTIEMLLASERNAPDLITQVSEWLARMELVTNFQIMPIDKERRNYEIRVKTDTDQSGGSLVDIGFGVSQVLPVITLLFSAPEGSIVLIEQPELHLHPSAQSHLADLFLHVAETRNLQLIIESHSEHLLARFQRRIAEGQQKLATPEHIKMYFCQSGADGSTIEPVQVNQYGQIANWPENFFGDIDGDLEAMSRAGLAKRRRELEESGEIQN